MPHGFTITPLRGTPRKVPHQASCGAPRPDAPLSDTKITKDTKSTKNEAERAALDHFRRLRRNQRSWLGPLVLLVLKS
jgi:hypothetical protein